MADKQTYTFNNEIDTVEVSSMGAKIIMMPQERADIYVEYDNPKDSPEFCAVLSGKALTVDPREVETYLTGLLQLPVQVR